MYLHTLKFEIFFLLVILVWFTFLKNLGLVGSADVFRETPPYYHHRYSKNIEGASTFLYWKGPFIERKDPYKQCCLLYSEKGKIKKNMLEWTRNDSYFMWGFVATRPYYYDTYVYHYVYIMWCSASADTSFSVLME